MNARYKYNNIKRMEILISVLKRFKTDWRNIQVTDLLLIEAKTEKKRCYILEIFIKYRVFFVSLLTIWFEDLLSNSNSLDIFNVSHILLFSLYAIVIYIIWTSLIELCLLIFTLDFFTYDAIGHDIRQFMIFGNTYSSEKI